MLGPALSFGFEKGIFEGKFFEDWLRNPLKAKRVRTFKDLIMKPFQDNPRFRYKLQVIAADISHGRLLRLPQDIEQYGENPDDLDVARTVRMSMSIPFFFEPVKLTHKKIDEVSYIVDGGVLSNFPVWLFDEGQEPAWPTFGFKLVEPAEEVEGVKHTINGPITMLAALFSTLMEAHDARYIAGQNFARTIAISTLDVRTTDFDITPQKSEALFKSGQAAAREFFKSWDFETYKEEYRRGTAVVTRRERVAPIVSA
ncbi:MAG: hypothetical protein C4294_06505 [Nitrospiraceae bacterium]